MRAFCKVSGQPFEISERDLAFYRKISPSFAGKLFPIPPPTLCPDERLRRRLAFRNQIYVYRRPSSATGDPIFSTYTDDVPFPVIETQSWWGEGFNGLEYGIQYDPALPFFTQFETLRDRVPHAPLTLIQCENSDYCANGSHNKNCYLVFNTSHAEDCMYSENVWSSKDCLDCTHTKRSELCYDCVMCTNCYDVQSSVESENCQSSFFLLNCRGCSNCFGCVNLRQKQYCVYNQQLTKEAYASFLNTLSLSSFAAREALAAKVLTFWQSQPRPHATLRGTENVSGNYIQGSRNMEECYLAGDSEDCSYCMNIEEHCKDCYDYTIPGIHAELMYECVISGLNTFNLRFCYGCHEGCSDLLYCGYCPGSKDCFGCVGLKKQQYCILNTQYSRDEYEQLSARIAEQMMQTGEWGEFFPMDLSPIPYNFSCAARYFPLERDEARSIGLRWRDVERTAQRGAVHADDLPDTLPSTTQPITVISAGDGAPFLITKKELELYRKFNVPLPRKAYDERMTDRVAKMGSIKLFNRHCAKSGKPIRTIFPPDSPWVIWDRDVYEVEFSA